MIESVYKLLAAVGYTHPIHPVITHIPMGMLIGGFLFRLLSLKWQQFAKTAGYCYVVALIAAPFTALFGYMDWKHRLFGVMSGWIEAKFILTACLLVFLSITVYHDRKEAPGPWLTVLLYALCFFTGIGLGYVGGELAY